MGNHINIYDKDDAKIGSMNISLSCYAFLNIHVIKKYNPDYNDMDIANINEQLEPVYEQCEPYEEMMMLLFINDKSEFEESDIEHFDRAIEDYPEGINETPKKALIAFRDFLKEHKYLKTSYSHSTSAITVTEKAV